MKSVLVLKRWVETAFAPKRYDRVTILPKLTWLGQQIQAGATTRRETSDSRWCMIDADPSSNRHHQITAMPAVW